MLSCGVRSAKRRWSKRWRNFGGGGVRPSLPCIIACRQLMAHSSAQDRAMQRSLQASPSAGAFFFKMKKLLNEPDLNLDKGWERSDASGMSGRSYRFMPLMPGFRWPNMSTPTSTKSFWDSLSSPGSKRHILMENMFFSRISAGPHCQDRPAVLSGILDSGGLAAIFAGLEPAGLLYLSHFAGESPGSSSR